MAEEVRHATPEKPMNAMSAEFAIQRELAYRKRVAALLKHYDESGEGFMPLKLDSSNQNPLPTKKMPRQNEPQPSFIPSPHSHPESSSAKSSSLTPPCPLSRSVLNTTPTPQCQRTSLHQSPNLSGSKRKAPSSRTELPPHAHAKDRCCNPNIALTPPFMLASSNHKPRPGKKMPQRHEPETILIPSPHSNPKSSSAKSSSSTPPRQLSLSVQYSTPTGSKKKTPNGSHMECQPHAQAGDHHYSTNVALQKEKQKSLFCKICQVPCCGDFNMKQHLDGQKHKAKMRLANHGQGDVENKRWNCEVCNMWCTSEDTFMMHLRGRKHICSQYDREQRKGQSCRCCSESARLRPNFASNSMIPLP